MEWAFTPVPITPTPPPAPPPPPPAPPPPPPPPAPPIPIDATSLELDNCNFENATFVKTVRSDVTGDAFFDDLVFFKVSDHQSIWRDSDSSGTETYIYNANEGSAGIGVNNPAEQLHVEGSVRVENQTIANEYCDGQSTVCLHADQIGGSGSNCPTGQAAYGISEGSIICAPVQWTVPTVQCPEISGEQTYLVAVSNKGQITCCESDWSNCQNYGP